MEDVGQRHKSVNEYGYCMCSCVQSAWFLLKPGTICEQSVALIAECERRLCAGLERYRDKRERTAWITLTQYERMKEATDANNMCLERVYCTYIFTISTYSGIFVLLVLSLIYLFGYKQINFLNSS